MEISMLSGVTGLGEKSRNKARGRFPRSAPYHLYQYHLHLRQPEGHVHLLVQGAGGDQGSAGLFPLASRSIQHAEDEVAMGLERAHAEFVSQGEAW
jgi:hypothetical protein